MIVLDGWYNKTQIYRNIRQSNYNSNVCMNSISLETVTDNFDGVFNGLVNFTDTIASIHMYPFDVPVVRNLNVEYKLKTSKGVQDASAYLIDYDRSYMNFGECQIDSYFNNFADYKGYTQIKVFLPFMGFVDVDVNECMSKWLQFRLFVDFFTGKGMWVIGVSNTSYNEYYTEKDEPLKDYDSKNMRIIANYECVVGIDIPLGTSNIGDIKRNILLGTVKTAVAVGTAIYTGTLPPPVDTSTTVKTYDVQGRGLSKGSRMKTIKSGTETTERTTVHNKPVNKLKPIADVIDGSIEVLNRNYVNNNSDRVNDTGLMINLSTNVIVVIYRPKMQPVGKEFGSLYGYPLGETIKLSKLTGYTEINNIHFEGEGFETITQKEISMLERIFSDGIIL